jgi:hypothetical protein
VDPTVLAIFVLVYAGDDPRRDPRPRDRPHRHRAARRDRAARQRAHELRGGRGGDRRLGVAIGWRSHARVGVPVALATLAVAAAWLALRAALAA